MSLDRPVSPDPYDLLPAVPSFTVTSDDVTDGQPLKDDQVNAARRHRRRSCRGPAPRRRPRASRSPASTPTRRRRAASGTGCWSTCPPTSPRSTPVPAPRVPTCPGNAFMCRNDGGSQGVHGRRARREGDQVHRYYFVVHAVKEESLGVDADASPPWSRSTWRSRPPAARSSTAPTSTEQRRAPGQPVDRRRADRRVGGELAPAQSACLVSSSKPASWAIRSSRPARCSGAGSRSSLAAPLGVEPEVVRDDLLVQHVVGVQTEVAGLGWQTVAALARRQLAQLGHPELDHEPATGHEVAGGVPEARDLLVLGEQVRDRVEDQVGQRELARRRAPSPCRR